MGGLSQGFLLMSGNACGPFAVGRCSCLHLKDELIRIPDKTIALAVSSIIWSSQQHGEKRKNIYNFVHNFWLNQLTCLKSSIIDEVCTAASVQQHMDEGYTVQLVLAFGPCLLVLPVINYVGQHPHNLMIINTTYFMQLHRAIDWSAPHDYVIGTKLPILVRLSRVPHE